MYTLKNKKMLRFCVLHFKCQDVYFFSFFDLPIENEADTHLNINQWRRLDKKSLFEVLQVSMLGI